jgi:hypothetical protein
MLEAMIAGERDPAVLAQLAIGQMRGRLTVLREAQVVFARMFRNPRGAMHQAGMPGRG